MFSVRGLRLYFPGLEPWVARSVTSPPVAASPASYSFARPTLQSATSLVPPAAAFPRFLSAPPTDLDECFFIYLVVGLPYSLIFCQFWLVFVFKFLLSFFCLYKEAQCVYLHLHLGQKKKPSLGFLQSPPYCLPASRLTITVPSHS